MTATPDAMGPAEFSRLLAAKYNCQITPQALGKAPFLPRDAFGKILVTDALVVLSDRGRITLDGEQLAAQGDLLEAQSQPEQAGESDQLIDEPAQADRKMGRPAAGSTLTQEQVLTERVKRRKMELELEEREGKLLRVEDVTDAMVIAGRRIGEMFDQLPALSEEIVSLAKAQGAPGVRDVLRRRVREMREQLADALTLSVGEEIEDDAE